MQRENKRSKLLLSVVFIVFLTGLDQMAKLLAIHFLKGGERILLIEGILELEYFENVGAAFNSFAGQGMMLILITVPVITVLAGKLLQVLDIKRYAGISFCICLIIAGAAGNLIDRVVRGYVVDFIYFRLIDFPIFNFADMCVVVGAGLTGLLLLLYYGEADVDFLLSFQGK